MLSDELTSEQLQDGLALATALKEEKFRQALDRLVEKLQSDAIRQWEADDADKFTKKWLRGYRQCITDLKTHINTLSQDATNQVDMKKRAEEAIHASPDGGLGNGDLAMIS